MAAVVVADLFSVLDTSVPPSFHVSFSILYVCLHSPSALHIDMYYLLPVHIDVECLFSH